VSLAVYLQVGYGGYIQCVRPRKRLARRVGTRVQPCIPGDWRVIMATPMETVAASIVGDECGNTVADTLRLDGEVCLNNTQPFSFLFSLKVQSLTAIVGSMSYQINLLPMQFYFAIEIHFMYVCSSDKFKSRLFRSNAKECSLHIATCAQDSNLIPKRNASHAKTHVALTSNEKSTMRCTVDMV
jgi:hypothetical protein